METTIVFPIVLVLTFGIVEFGYALWQYHMAEKATVMGARYLATRHGVKGANGVKTCNDGSGGNYTCELWTSTVEDCFFSEPDAIGTPCSQVTGINPTTWLQTCTGAGAGSCNSAVMSRLLTEMKNYAPFIAAANVKVELRGSDMGFLGRSRPIPLVSVKTTGLTYNFVAIGKLLGLSSITMPGFTSTLVAEDQKEGTGI